MGKKFFPAFDNVFHVYLMGRLQTLQKKKISRWLFEIIHIIRIIAMYKGKMSIEDLASNTDWLFFKRYTH